MAGSYLHVTNNDGSFIGDRFTDSIENLGDAWEACEEMHWMIHYLASSTQAIAEARSEYYCFVRGERPDIVHHPLPDDLQIKED